MVKITTIENSKNALTEVETHSRDVLFLVGVVLMMQAYFVRKLGFYSDDWFFLYNLDNAKSHSIGGLMQSLLHYNSFVVRPIQALQLSVLYWLFGTKPFGYHVVNTLIFTLTIVLFHLALTKLKVPRIIAVGIPLVYALLPHYSTTHFWVASFCANLSTCFYFLNLYAGLCYIKSDINAWQRKTWLFICLASVLICVLTYEIILPLFFLSILTFWFEQRKSTAWQFDSGRRKIDALLIGNVLLLIAGIAFKLLVSERAGGIKGSYISHVLMVFRVVLVNDYWMYGLKLPLIMWKIVGAYYNPQLFSMGAMLFVVVFLYFYRLNAELLKPSGWIKLIAVGVIIYFAGYAVFLTTRNFQVTSTGLSNRIVVVAAIGIAICYVAAAGLLCTLIKKREIQNIMFSLIIAALVFCGYVINGTISVFYEAAYSKQLAVLDNIYANTSGFTKHTTLILDGVCPYLGPVPIFDCHWDLSGALSLHYKLPIKADVRTNRLSYDKTGIRTIVYGETKLYPYSKDLLVYNYKTKKSWVLSSFKEATFYFLTLSPGLGECPVGLEGVGLKIF